MLCTYASTCTHQLSVVFVSLQRSFLVVAFYGFLLFSFFLMRRKMKSFSGFFSGRFPADALPLFVYCSVHKCLRFFSASLWRSPLSRCLLPLYIFAVMNTVFFRLAASALATLKCRQAGQAVRRDGWSVGRAGLGSLALSCGMCILFKYCVCVCVFVTSPRVAAACMCPTK